MSNLTKHQGQEINSFHKLRVFLKDHETIADSRPAFKDEKKAFFDNCDELDTVLPNKQGTTAGIIDDKDTLKHTIANTTAMFCDSTRAFGIKFNHPELAAEMRTNESDIFRMKDSDIIGYVVYITGLIKPFIGTTDFDAYEIKQADLDAVVLKAQEFNNKIGVAQEQASHSTIGNTQIDDVLKDLRGNRAQMDLLIGRFQKDNPEFVQGYHINSAIDNVGIRHTGIEGIVKDENGNPIFGAVIRLKNTHYEAKSDLKGAYHLIKVLTADYEVEVMAPGYQTSTQVYHITRGKISELNFTLKKA